MVEIPPDWTTFFTQIAVFLVLWLVLKRFWFEPAQRVLKERERRTEGAMQEARRMREEAEKLRAEHEAALEEARSEAQREVNEILRAAEAEHKRIIAQAAEDAQRTLTEVRARVADEVNIARSTLQNEVHAIAREVAQTVVGRTV
jgi:F-type H+-transporting ATPase subunit b